MALAFDFWGGQHVLSSQEKRTTKVALTVRDRSV
jgi:hypothetical protein